MKNISEKIIFLGSGPVAAKSLRLLAQNFQIEAVITKPSTKKEMSDIEGSVFSVNNRAELSNLIASQHFTSRLAILIDFGIIVSQDVIDYFPLGIINSHFSLLPEWRGADPITFSILSGQEKTGVSLMLLTAGMDEGPLLAQAPVELTNDVTTPELTDKLIEVSDTMIREILPLYASGKIAPKEQDKSIKPTYSRKLTKDDSILDWTKPAEQLEREIRAFIEWPKSRTVLAGKDVIITEAKVLTKKGDPGRAGKTPDKKIVVFCGEGALLIEKLKPAGKKEMTAKEFLAGYKL